MSEEMLRFRESTYMAPKSQWGISFDLFSDVGLFESIFVSKHFCQGYE